MWRSWMSGKPQLNVQLVGAMMSVFFYSLAVAFTVTSRVRLRFQLDLAEFQFTRDIVQ